MGIILSVLYCFVTMNIIFIAYFEARDLWHNNPRAVSMMALEATICGVEWRDWMYSSTSALITRYFKINDKTYKYHFIQQ